MSTIKIWKWWQKKNPPIVVVNEPEYNSSIAQSSLIVQRSIHSKESEDITSTTSIKSKPYVLKEINQDTNSTIVNHAESNLKKSSASNSSRSLSFESKNHPETAVRFSGLKEKFGKWVKK